jgi:hypothetical protein
MKTIEGDIYEAFAKAGAILQANAGDPGKVQNTQLLTLTFIEQLPESCTHRQGRSCSRERHLSQAYGWR